MLLTTFRIRLGQLSERKSALRIAVEKRIVKFLREGVVPILSKIVAFLESKGLTRRLVKYLLIITLFIFGFLAMGMMALLLLFFASTYLPSWFNAQVRANVINYSEVVTLFIAEIPILIMTGIFLHFILGESRAPTAELSIFSITPDSSTGTVTWRTIVGNDGDIAAMSCQARLTLNDIKAKDILKIEGTESKFQPENLVTPLRISLRCGSEREPTIRSGDDVTVEVLRVVPESQNVPLHFEIPSEDGWQPISLALKPDYYSMSLKVVPLNGKRATKRLQVTYTSDEKWALISLFPH